MKNKGHWSPEVIRAFYSSLEYRIRERVILANVRWKKIIINEAKFADVLGLPAPESEFFYFTDHHNSLSDSFLW